MVDASPAAALAPSATEQRRALFLRILYQSGFRPRILAERTRQAKLADAELPPLLPLRVAAEADLAAGAQCRICFESDHGVQVEGAYDPHP